MIVNQTIQTLAVNQTESTKKQMLQVGTRVLVAHNLEGNMDEPFIGKEGVIIIVNPSHSDRTDWYKISLDDDTIYGKRFNFHIDELEII